MKRLYILLMFTIGLALSPMYAQETARKVIDHASHGSDYRYGFVDANENWIISPRYDEAAWHGVEGFAIVTTYGPAEKGVIDKYGDFIIPMDNYTRIRYDKPSDTFIVVKKIDGVRLSGVANREGKLIIPMQYLQMEYDTTYSCFRAESTNGVHTYFDKTGKVVSAPFDEY